MPKSIFTYLSPKIVYWEYEYIYPMGDMDISPNVTILFITLCSRLNFDFCCSYMYMHGPVGHLLVISQKVTQNLTASVSSSLHSGDTEAVSGNFSWCHIKQGMLLPYRRVILTTHNTIGYAFLFVEIKT